MYEGFDIWVFLAGLPLGLIIVSIVMFIFFKRGKRDRIFDERYKRIHQHARSISWVVTTAAILIAWMIVILIEGPSLAFFILTGIWVTHMMSYLIGALIANKNN